MSIFNKVTRGKVNDPASAQTRYANDLPIGLLINMKVQKMSNLGVKVKRNE